MIYVYRFTVGDTLDERRVWQYVAVVPSSKCGNNPFLSQSVMWEKPCCGNTLQFYLQK